MDRRRSRLFRVAIVGLTGFVAIVLAVLALTGHEFLVGEIGLGIAALWCALWSVLGLTAAKVNHGKDNVPAFYALAVSYAVGALAFVGNMFASMSGSKVFFNLTLGLAGLCVLVFPIAVRRWIKFTESKTG